jgi:cholesterol oxidase
LIIHREDRENVAILEFHRGESDLVDIALVEALEKSLDEIVSHSNIRAIVLTGHDSVFIDDGGLSEVAEGSATYSKTFLSKFSALVKRLFTLQCPTVAAINGNAFTSGYILAAACDLRVMTTGKASIGIQGLALGPTPLEVLRFQIPTKKFQDMINTEKHFDSQEALEIGLVDELASPDKVVDRAVELASQLGNIADSSFLQTKKQIRQPALERIERYSAKWEAEVDSAQAAEQQQAPATPGRNTSIDDADVPLNHPVGVAVDSSGFVYVGDFDNHTIRKVTPEGRASTLAGYTGEAGSRDGKGSEARLNGPRGVALDSAGNVYVADNLNNVIRKVTPDGMVSTLAGVVGEAGSNDGVSNTARFNSPVGMTVDQTDNVYVADFLNSTIRKITPDGVVSTLAGVAGETGASDGPVSEARFQNPGGLGVDSHGSIYVGDSGNATVRKITPEGIVSTLAGVAGETSASDGVGGEARFIRTGNPAIDTAGNIYVADNGNHTIRKITPEDVVSTLAGVAAEPGFSDGTGSAARFNGPIGVAVDTSGNIYVGDMDNNAIRKITPSGVVSTLVGSPNVSLRNSQQPASTNQAQPLRIHRTPNQESEVKMLAGNPQKLATDHSQLKDHYDVLIIGSGYGGAIPAARLGYANAKAGGNLDIAILERGAEQLTGDFPVSTPEFAGDLKTPLNPLGLFEFIISQDFGVVQGNGLGGTSLVNGTICIEPDREAFDLGWPKAIREDGPYPMQEYYDRALAMLDAVHYADEVSLDKARVMQKISDAVGGTNFRALNLAISLKPRVTKYGIPRLPCVNCSSCISGCNYEAKNTLDKNYLPMAKHFGVDMFTRMEVDFLQQLPNGGYELTVRKRIGKNGENFIPTNITADRVIVGAGCLGTTGLLLRSQAATRMRFSKALGEHFSGNGDFFALGYNMDEVVNMNGWGVGTPQEFQIKVGPVITTVFDMYKDKPIQERIIFEEATMPAPFVEAMRNITFASAAGQPWEFLNTTPKLKRWWADRERNNTGAINSSVLYLGIGFDEADGVITLDGSGNPYIVWPDAAKDPVFQRQAPVTIKGTEALGGNQFPNPLFVFNINLPPSLPINRVPITGHPIGGCSTSDDVDNGVIDDRGRVYHPDGGVYEGLYVTDGSIFPNAIGVNVLLTISAFAERASEFLREELGLPGFNKDEEWDDYV